MNRVTSFLAVCAAALSVCGAAAAHPAPQTAPGSPIDPRTYAPQSKPFLELHAIGVQKYACQTDGTWLFVAPEATLYKQENARTPVGSHFLNFVTGRPIWWFKDGSSVEAARVASAPGAAGSIPWLLLQTVSTGNGGGDGDRLLPTTWVQRLDTSGGVAPAGTCASGESVEVPYEADYVFWKAKGGREDADD
jgi:uncharacterized protein DUF3455